MFSRASSGDDIQVCEPSEPLKERAVQIIHLDREAEKAKANTLISVPILTQLLASSATLNGLDSLGPVSFKLSELENQEKVKMELESKVIENDSAERNRRARVKCLPLIQLVYEVTGYSFVSVFDF